mgnify:FL=1
MQDIGLIEFGDSGLNLVIKLIGSERKTFGAYHIFVMIMYMEHMGFATFWLGGHSKGLWKSSAHGGAGKTVR